MRRDVHIGSELWRVILLRENGSELLVFQNTVGFVLPRVRIPALTRVARALNSEIKAAWGLEVYSLFELASATTSTRKRVPPCCVMEVTRPNATAPEGAQWLPAATAAVASFAEGADIDAIREWWDGLARSRSAATHSPLGQPGCVARVRAWVQQVFRACGMTLEDQFDQFNASPSFSLIRFETSGDAVWFKAVGEPNVRELAISRALARLFPKFVPRLVATREDWNAWLTLEVNGTHPDENADIAKWTSVAAALANLQIASIGNALHLVEAGCKDVRAPRLMRLVDPFLDTMGKLMEQQVKPSPLPLSRSEIALLGKCLKDVLSTDENFYVPNTLGHLDFNPGNILVSEDGVVFLDWAEACVGHPFLTFRYLTEFLTQNHLSASTWLSQITSAYVGPWRCFLTAEVVDRALAVSPLLAVAAYALSLDAWRVPDPCASPETAGYLRSLTRRMKREADVWALQQSCSVSSLSPSPAEVPHVNSCLEGLLPARVV
jgi:hypothetical protein